MWGMRQVQGLAYRRWQLSIALLLQLNFKVVSGKFLVECSYPVPGGPNSRVHLDMRRWHLVVTLLLQMKLKILSGTILTYMSGRCSSRHEIYLPVRLCSSLGSWPTTEKPDLDVSIAPQTGAFIGRVILLACSCERGARSNMVWSVSHGSHAADCATRKG